MPPDWDNPLPSDVALKFPGDSAPVILLSAQADVEPAGFDRASPVVSVIFCDKLKKAYVQLSSRGILAAPIEDSGELQFFEIGDIEGRLIEICKEPWAFPIVPKGRPNVTPKPPPVNPLRSAMTGTVQHAQIGSPRTDRITILVSHHAR